jgi:hypothetical protein
VVAVVILVRRALVVVDLVEVLVRLRCVAAGTIF